MDTYGLTWLEQVIPFNGSSVVAPYAGVDYRPGSGRRYCSPAGEDCIEETLILNLRGGDAVISQALSSLQRLLNEVNHPPGSPSPGRPGLFIQRPAEAAPWLSPLLGGRMEIPGNPGRERIAGIQGIRLVLQRPDYWQSAAAVELPLSNTGGSRVTGGLRISNHLDAGHENFVEVAAADAPGDLPAPLRIELQHIHTSGAGLGDVYIHQLVENLSASLPNVLEAEAAAAGSGVSRSLLTSATESGGQAVRLEWNAAPTPAELLRWTLSPAFLGWAARKPLRPLLRFSTPQPEMDLWLGWQIFNGSQAVWSSPPVLLPAGRALVDLPGLILPPLQSLGETGAALFSGLELVLTACKTSPAACSLDLDFIQLLPLDGWRRLFASRVLEYGQWLVEDGIEDATYGLQPLVERLPGHVGVGERLMLHPGRRQRFYFLNTTGAEARIDLDMTVKLSCQPRRRHL